MDEVDVLVALARAPQLERPRRDPRRSRRRAARSRRRRGRVESANGESPARFRISFACARPIPASARWSRSSGCSGAVLAREDLAPARSASTSSASGPRCASSASSLRPVSRSQTPARFFLPASVSTSSPPPSKRSRNTGVFGPSRRARGSAAGRRSSGGRGARALRRRSGRAGSSRAAARPRSGAPRARASGGSNDFSVATCAGPARTRRRRARRGASSSRTQASTSGSSGMRSLGSRRGLRPSGVVVPRGERRRGAARVHAVAVQDGAVDRRGRRSEARHVSPLLGEAVPGPAARPRAARSRRTSEIAIASASHSRDPSSSTAVRRCSRRHRRTEDELECGAGEPDAELEHNCSGKHAGMLALCRAQGWATQRVPPAATIRSAGDAAPRSRRRRTPIPARSPSAIDGCGVSTFAMPLERMALMFSRLESLDGGAPGRAAMRAHPELIRGPGAADSLLMRELDGLGREGRRRGPDVRGRPGRARDRAQGRGRDVARGRARRSPSSSRRLGFDDARARPSRRSRTRLGEIVGEIVRGPVQNRLRIRLPALAECRCSIRSPRWSEPGLREPALCVSRQVAVRPVHSRGKPRSMLTVDIALPEVEELQKLVAARTGEGVPDLRRDRRRPRGGRAHEGADRGLLHLPDRPLDRAGRGRAAQVAAARAARARRGGRSRRRSSTSPSSRRSTRCGSTCARSARCRS